MINYNVCFSGFGVLDGEKNRQEFQFEIVFERGSFLNWLYPKRTKISKMSKIYDA